MILNKWKLFALRQYLSDWHGDEMALFDALESGENLTETYEKHGVVPWYPFEYMDKDNPVELAEIIVNAARSATETDIKG